MDLWFYVKGYVDDDVVDKFPKFMLGQAVPCIFGIFRIQNYTILRTPYVCIYYQNMKKWEIIIYVTFIFSPHISNRK